MTLKTIIKTGVLSFKKFLIILSAIFAETGIKYKNLKVREKAIIITQKKSPRGIL